MTQNNNKNNFFVFHFIYFYVKLDARKNLDTFFGMFGMETHLKFCEIFFLMNLKLPYVKVYTRVYSLFSLI